MANQEHVNILKLTLRERITKVWEKWRSDNPQIEPDLSEENLKGLFLQEIDFKKTNLSKANLTKVNLRDANLEEANLSNSNLEEASLLCGNLTKANLSSSNLKRADLGGANLREANLSDSNLREAILLAADLRGANLRGADLFSTNFTSAICTLETTFPKGFELENQGIYLLAPGVSLNNVVFSYFDLKGSNLSHSNLKNSYLLSANFSLANLSNANLENVNLKNANLSGANLENANLSSANLENANLSGANLENANLSGANLKTAYLGQVIGLTKEQVKLAVNWNEAKYDLELSKELGLPQLALPVNELSYPACVTTSPDEGKSKELEKTYSYDEIVAANVKLIPVETSINKLGVVIVAAIILGLIIIAVSSKAIN